MPLVEMRITLRMTGSRNTEAPELRLCRAAVISQTREYSRGQS